MKALCLISGGIDSPVAAAILKNQGVSLDFITFYLNEKTIPKINKLISKISQESRLFSLNYRNIQESIRNKTNNRYQCILCKRMMYRIAENISRKNSYDFLATGENLGQVASQTLENMSVLDNAVTTTVLRPLLTYDKNEIINKSKAYGLYDISIFEQEKCPYVPQNPATKAKLQIILQEEARIDIQKLLQSMI
jgi:thiamine biosynthesis protein ThiI